MQKRRDRLALVLEDEPLIALDLENALRSAGYIDVVVTFTKEEAIEWLQRHRPDIAVVDFQLKDGTCEDVAARLVEKNVPFIVCSGTLFDDMSPTMQRGAWLNKPWTLEQLHSALEAAKEQAKTQQD